MVIARHSNIPLRHIALGITIWAMAVLLGTSWWALLEVGGDRDPTTYADAKAYYQWSVDTGAISQAEADRRLSQRRAQLFRWLVRQVRPAVLLSAVLIPVLVLLLIRYPHDRWIAVSLALLCAAVVPWFALMVAIGLPNLGQPGPVVGHPPVATPAATVSAPPSWNQ